MLSVDADRTGWVPGSRPPAAQSYLGALTRLAGLRIAFVREGFGIPGLSEDDVDESVRGTAQDFEKLGASVEEVSIPWHRQAMAVWNAVALEGATRLMVAGEGMATGWKGRYSTSMMGHFARGRLDGDRLSDTVKLTLLARVDAARAPRPLREGPNSRARPRRRTTRCWRTAICWSCRPCR